MTSPELSVTPNHRTQTIDLPFGQDVPPLPAPCVSRENILNTIDLMFAEGINVTILEGPEGRGKTVTAALFARRFFPRAFTTFLRPGSRWAYDPVMVYTELGQQISRFQELSAKRFPQTSQ